MTLRLPAMFFACAVLQMNLAVNADPVATTNYIKTIAITNQVKVGTRAKASFQTNPHAKCIIQVIDSTGENNSRNLSPKMADKTGNVAWSWKPSAGKNLVSIHSFSGNAMTTIQKSIVVE